MKYIKLLLIFILFAAGIFFAINWDSIFSGTTSEEEFPQEDKLNIKEQCENIRKGWSAVSEWDQELYQHQREDIDQSKAMGLFSMEGYNTVNNTLRETATNKACEAYNNELKSSDFKDANLVRHHNGVLAIMKAEKLDNDTRITKVLSIHKLYTNIKNFVNSSHNINPHFDTRRTDWLSFASAQNKIISAATAYKKNPLYSELKQIPGFEAGLDEGKLKAATNSQRANFYYGLSRQIVSYFNGVEATQENVNLFNQIYKNFSREDSDHGLDALATALVELKSKVSSGD